MQPQRQRMTSMVGACKLCENTVVSPTTHRRQIRPITQKHSGVQDASSGRGHAMIEYAGV
eukprot:1147287-Pelagomonas_calceolata.AAC.12